MQTSGALGELRTSPALSRELFSSWTSLLLSLHRLNSLNFYGSEATQFLHTSLAWPSWHHHLSLAALLPGKGKHPTQVNLKRVRSLSIRPCYHKAGCLCDCCLVAVGTRRCTEIWSRQLQRHFPVKAVEWYPGEQGPVLAPTMKSLEDAAQIISRLFAGKH